LFAYRLLVSNPRVPEWQPKYIRGLARQRDLYTVSSGNKELDDFERWISTEFEQPANVAVYKLEDGKRLKREDWHSIARFLAVQDVRTPRSFIESMRRWEQEMPNVLETTMREAVKEFESANKDGTVLKQNREHNEFSGLIKVDMERSPSPDSNQTIVQAEISMGRRWWIASMRHLLNGVAEKLCDHQWSIAEPAGNTEWPLTDHPVLKLNYYGPGKYDFGGGWGRRGSEIMMPLTPRHLLFVHVGTDAGRKMTFTREQTMFLQELLVERAYRWVFATEPLEWVRRIRPRKVDAEAFADEKGGLGTMASGAVFGRSVSLAAQGWTRSMILRVFKQVVSGWSPVPRPKLHVESNIANARR